MESTHNNNNNQIFLSEFKQLRNELSAMKKRIDQLENFQQKQQERIDILERENHALKKETELNINGIKESGSVLDRKRADQVYEKESESKPPVLVSVSAGKKKTKTNINDEADMISRYDNGDSFDSLSDDLLHKIVEFDGNCYSKFGLINKRCRNIYNVKEYKLKKQTCLYGYGTLDMMLQHYLQKRRDGELWDNRAETIGYTLIWYDRLDAIDWIIQLEDSKLLRRVFSRAARYGRINILSKIISKCNLTMLCGLLNDVLVSHDAASNGKLETLRLLRKYGAVWDTNTFIAARDEGYDKIVQYLRTEGCPEPSENRDESSESEQLWSDGDY